MTGSRCWSMRRLVDRREGGRPGCPCAPPRSTPQSRAGPRPCDKDARPSPALYTNVYFVVSPPVVRPAIGHLLVSPPFRSNAAVTKGDITLLGRVRTSLRVRAAIDAGETRAEVAHDRVRSPRRRRAARDGARHRTRAARGAPAGRR